MLNRVTTHFRAPFGVMNKDEFRTYVWTAGGAVALPFYLMNDDLCSPVQERDSLEVNMVKIPISTAAGALSGFVLSSIPVVSGAVIGTGLGIAIYTDHKKKALKSTSQTEKKDTQSTQ